ncbi:SRPBCC family protein [Dokdonella sp.]|uniref:SRPBCC family protein n=1 Tax=Dokdonella sp. TaxID=2291710 RepID=UPI003526F82F
MTNTITKEIEISAPVSRVWKALTDHKEFGEWFRVRIDGPFRQGELSRGQITVPGYEHVKWEATVTLIEPERRFAYTWHPYAVEPDTDYSKEEPTLVEFTLKPSASGTLLKVVESGFDRIPEGRRPEALRMNTGGWEAQLKNIKRHAE